MTKIIGKAWCLEGKTERGEEFEHHEAYPSTDRPTNRDWAMDARSDVRDLLSAGSARNLVHAEGNCDRLNVALRIGRRLDVGNHVGTFERCGKYQDALEILTSMARKHEQKKSIHSQRLDKKKRRLKRKFSTERQGNDSHEPSLTWSIYIDARVYFFQIP